MIVHRCARCAVEYEGPDPPPSCGRCCGALYRLPDSWAGQALDHAPRPGRLLSAYQVRARRTVRRPAGPVLAPIFGPELPAALSLVVTGVPGAGKSTWTLRALESGAWQKPVLVAAEEGVEGVGLAERVARLEATRTQFSDACSIPEIIAMIDEHEPDVVAIDSVTVLGLLPEDLVALRRSYEGTSIIAVVQSTKDGSHRGSQAWLHDADAVLRLDQGGCWALTKSWFCPLGTGENKE